MFDLKQLREQARLTQSQLAKRLGTSQVQISRYEASPGNLPINLAGEYLFALGLDLATEVNRARNSQLKPPPDCEQPYTDLQDELSEIASYLNKIQNKAPEPIHPQLHPQALNNALNNSNRKPTLLLTGAVNAGKSHLGNYLLGTRILPAGYQPETKIPVYIRHSSDRPAHIQEDVWIMDNEFKPHQWQELRHGEAHKLIAGNNFTLNDWATHSGQYSGQKSGAALLFMNSPVLHNCQLIDIPGNPHDILDPHHWNTLIALGDLIIYLSPANDFLNANDLIHLHNIRQQMLSTSHLLVVASHADPSISEKKLADIIERGKARFTTENNNTVGTEQHIFSFWEETSARNEMLTKHLNHLLSSTFPKQIKAQLNNMIDCFKEAAGTRQEGYPGLNFDEEYTNCHPATLCQKDPRRQKIISQILCLREESSKAISPLVSEEIDVKAIATTIKKHYCDKSEAQQYASAHITNELQRKVSAIAQQATMNLLPEIQQYIKDFNQPALPQVSDTQKETSKIPLNTRGLVFGSTAGLAGLGPLAAWASQLGPWGSYLVFSESATLLGLGSTSTSAVITTVAAIGGPGVVAAAVVATGAIMGTSFIGSNWRQRLAKKINKNIISSGFEEQIIAANQAYWGNILREFEQNSLTLESELHARQAQRQHLSPAINGPELQHLHKKAAKNYKQLIDKIPSLS